MPCLDSVPTGQPEPLSIAGFQLLKQGIVSDQLVHDHAHFIAKIQEADMSGGVVKLSSI